MRYQYYDGGLIQFAMPVIPALILAGLMAAAFAFLIGLPVLRLKSDYLAIATLGFAEIIRSIFATNRKEMIDPLVKDILYYAFRTTDMWECGRGVRGRLTDYEVNITASCLLLLFELPPSYESMIKPLCMLCCDCVSIVLKDERVARQLFNMPNAGASLRHL